MNFLKRRSHSSKQLKFLLIPLLFLYIPFNGHACDCVYKNLVSPSEETLKTVRESSECILVGKIHIVDVKNQIFEVTVTESLDGGDVQGNMYLGKGWKYCFPYFDHDTTWLIYGYTENGYLRPHICGISKGFDTFGQKQIGTNENHSLTAEQDSIYQEIRKDFLNSLYLELKALRQWRKQRFRKNKSTI